MPANIAIRPEWHAGVPHQTHVHAVFGFAFLAALLVGFGTWAGSAPIAGAIVTSGAFVASGQNKTIQHLEGGIIRSIRVKEGDIVAPGQSLILLDDTTAKAELRRLILRESRLAAIEARLKAEMDEKEAIEFPSALLAQVGDQDVADILRNQTITFVARENNLKSDIATLKDGIDGLEEKIKGTLQQRASVHDQIGFLQQELDGKNWLLKGGEIRKSEVLTLQRARANAEGELGRLDGDIGEARERISRTREQMLGARNGAIKAAAEQLNDMHAEQNDVRERIRAAKAVLERIDITAPVRGIVVKLRYFTAGGVVEPGKPVMEIVPLEDDLVIEARVRPQDIANLKQGQTANVRLTALSARITPMVQGHVVYVSADALPDDKRGQYSATDQYVARIKLDPEEAARIKQFSPMPGMPAEVYIKTSERTFLQYLTKPIRDSMQRAFRET
jgi:HlyD family type I secretion membrane fusion protein